MIDTHCHLDMPAFDADREAVWSRARAAGVRAVIVPGVEPASWTRTCDTARDGERYVALGIHPQALPDLDDATVDAALATLADRARDAKAVAIGECGFDGAIDLERAPFERQRRVFFAHAEIARALARPLIVHVFRAHGEAQSAIRALATRDGAGVLHSYSGPADLVAEYVSRGFYISFAGAVTRPNARRPVEAARAVPADRLLLETDAPDQPPTGAPPSGANGRRCEPSHLALTAAALARIHGTSLDALVAETTENARRLFVTVR